MPNISTPLTSHHFLSISETDPDLAAATTTAVSVPFFWDSYLLCIGILGFSFFSSAIPQSKPGRAIVNFAWAMESSATLFLFFFPTSALREGDQRGRSSWGVFSAFSLVFSLPFSLSDSLTISLLGFNKYWSWWLVRLYVLLCFG